MLNNEEKGILISFLDSISSTFDNLNFDNEAAPWKKTRWDVVGEKDTTGSVDYYVEFLTQKFVDHFLGNGINLILNIGGKISVEKKEEVREFISKNFVVLDESIITMKERIYESVRNFSNEIFTCGKNVGRDEERLLREAEISIIEAESKRNSRYDLRQSFFRIQWFDKISYRMGQLETYFTIKCSKCGLDMHFNYLELQKNSDAASIVSRVLNEYIDEYCRDHSTGEIREDLDHDISFESRNQIFDYTKGSVQSIFSYELGLLHQHLSKDLGDGRTIHFDEYDSGWGRIVRSLNDAFKSWRHNLCPEIPWRNK